jgi:hypothetical protein
VPSRGAVRGRAMRSVPSQGAVRGRATRIVPSRGAAVGLSESRRLARIDVGRGREGPDMASLLDPADPEVRATAVEAREILIRLRAAPCVARLDAALERPSSATGTVAARSDTAAEAPASRRVGPTAR